jgi:hypothetical protein
VLIRNKRQLDELESQVTAAAKRAVERVHKLLSEADPLYAFAALKFEAYGFHPTVDRPLNLIEQINQTFTYIASARAARWLFENHPDLGPLRLNLGTAGGTDVESIDGSIAAETFASVDPRNNRKLEEDVAKVARTSAIHKYVFYICPQHPAKNPVISRLSPDVKIVSLGWK